MKEDEYTASNKTEIIHYINVSESFYDKMYDVICASKNMELIQYTVNYKKHGGVLHLVYNVLHNYEEGLNSIKGLKIPFDEKENIVNQILNFKLKIDTQKVFEFSRIDIYFVLDMNEEFPNE